MAKKEEKERYSAGQVATETSNVVVDYEREEGEQALSTEEALSLILNKLEKIEKSVAG